MLISIFTAAVSTVSWAIECIPFFRRRRAIKAAYGAKKGIPVLKDIKFIMAYLKALTELWRPAVDITLTIAFASIFGAGTVSGAVMAMTFTSVVSVALIYNQFTSTQEA